MTEAVSQMVEFQPPSIQSYSQKHPEYAHRFIDTGRGNRRGDRLQYWLNQGWEIAPYGNEGMKGNRDTGTTSDDRAVHYRGLVLIRVARAAAVARNRFYAEKNQRLLQANQAMRDLAGKSKDVNRETKRKGLTSAFAEARITKGDRVLEESSADTTRDPEKVLRDVDPRALRELQEKLEAAQEEARKARQESEQLRREQEERARRPSDRRRKSFPVS